MKFGDSTPFHEQLQSWMGPAFMKKEAEDSGFHVHSAFRKIVSEFCVNRCLPSDIDKYFDEVSMEFVSSAGLKFDRGIHHLNDGFYRSSVLDSYQEDSAGDQEYQLSPSSVHPCVRRFHLELESAAGHELRSKIDDALGAQKYLEFKQLNLSTDQWSGSQSDAISLIWEVSRQFGYDKCQVNWKEYPDIKEVFLIPDESGLIFYGYIDLKRTRGRIRSIIPINFFVGYDRPVFSKDLYLSDLRQVLPGAEYYARDIHDGEAAVLGIVAILGIFRIFSRSFDSRSTHGSM